MLAELHGWHLAACFLLRDALVQLALVGLARGQRGARALGGVEAEAGLAVAAVGAVAGEALVREDRPDVAVERDATGEGRRGNEQECGEQEAGHAETHGGATRAVSKVGARGRRRDRQEAGMRGPLPDGRASYATEHS